MTHPSDHHFRIVANLAMGLPEYGGWVRKLIVRQCRYCAYCEAIHGAEHLGMRRNRLVRWEMWEGRKTPKEGDFTGWKLPTGVSQ